MFKFVSILCCGPVCLYAVASIAATPEEASLPSGVLRQLPPGFEPMTFAKGELDGDSLPDYLVALRIKDEEAKYQRTGEGDVRPLLIFVQQTDGTFKLVKRNDNVVLTIDAGGQCDPFNFAMEGLFIKNRYFTVQNAVACGDHWTDFMTFRYDTQLRDWVFHKRIVESQVSGNDPDGDALVDGERKVESANKKMPVRFDRYQPSND